jgi:hypothetical protein
VRALRALVLGALAGAVLAYVAAMTAALALSAAGTEVEIAAGPLVFLAVDRTADGVETTFGPGLTVIPVLFALTNALAATLLAHRIRDGPMS